MYDQLYGKKKNILFQGDFRSVTIPGTKFPFEHVSLPSFQPKDCVDKMVCMWATEDVANTASVVYKRAGKIVYSYKKDAVSHFYI